MRTLVAVAAVTLLSGCAINWTPDVPFTHFDQVEEHQTVAVDGTGIRTERRVAKRMCNFPEGASVLTGYPCDIAYAKWKEAQQDTLVASSK